MPQPQKRRKPPAAAQRAVWVVIHCEFFPRSDDVKLGTIMDEMVFHVSSSLKATERYVRRLHMSSYSWWKVERRVIDEDDFDADDRPVTHFFNHRGLPRKNPQTAARRAFDRDYPAMLKDLRLPNP